MSNLSDIGFEVASIEDFRTLAEMVYYEGTGMRAGEGFYVRYEEASGAELWLQIDARNEVVGMNPHFAGSTRRAIHIESTISRRESPMDGALKARFRYEDPDSGELTWCDFVFDLPDAHMLPAMRLPAAVDVQLTAFATEIYALSGEPHTARPRKFAMRSHQAMNAAAGGGVATQTQLAQAVMAGEIRHFETRTNAHTGKAFWYLRIATLGGEMDVVADPGLWPETPKAGMFLKGDFWLSGRVEVPESLKPRKGFLERLFWGS